MGYNLDSISIGVMVIPMKRFVTGFVLGAALTAGTAVLANQPIRLFVNEREISFPEAPPTIINGRTMVPARPLAEALGAKVEWDGTRRAVIVTKAGDIPETGTISQSVPIGSSLTKNDVSITVNRIEYRDNPDTPIPSQRYEVYVYFTIRNGATKPIQGPAIGTGRFQFKLKETEYEQEFNMGGVGRDVRNGAPNDDLSSWIYPGESRSGTHVYRYGGPVTVKDLSWLGSLGSGQQLEIGNWRPE